MNTANRDRRSTAGKAAIVTGGGTGIGAAISLRLAKDGYPVTVAYCKSRDAAHEVCKQIKASGGQASTCRADVADAGEVAQLFAHARKEHGEIHAVISNAGIGHMSNLADTSDEDYDRIFATNTRGSFNVCREAARHVIDGGCIINISSGITDRSMAGMGLYAASKLAIEGFSKTLAQELGERSITVNTVSPGMTETPMLDGAKDPQALRAFGTASAAMKRMGQPDDIADMVAVLVSHDGRWVSGQNVHVDGGTVIT